MKLQSIHLSNFSSHRDTTVSFEKPVTLVVGHLNQGKSGILQGLEFALIGETERYRKKTCNFQDLIHDIGRTEESRAVATLKTAEGIAKRIRPMVGPTAFTFDGATENAEIKAYAAWKTDKDIISALLSTGDFFDKDAKDQKELVLKLLGANVTTESIKIQAAFDGDVANGLAMLTIKDFDSLQSLDHAYDEAFRRRTDVNRQLKQLQPPPMPEGKQPDIQAIRDRLAGIEADRSHQQAALGAARQKANQQSPRKFIEKQLSELEDWLEAHPEPATADLQAMKDKRALVVSEKNKARGELDALSKELESFRAQRFATEQQLKTLQAAGGVVCACGEHKCSDALLTSLRDGHKATLDGLVKKMDPVQKKVSEMESSLNDNSDIAALDGQIATFEYSVREWTQKAKKADELGAELDKLPAEEVSDNSDEIKKLETGILELDGRIRNGRATLENAQGWELRKAQVDRVAAQRKDLETQSRYLEALVTFFGPKGVKVKLIEEKTKAFEDMVNDGVRAFGFEFGFTAEPWKITAKGRPVDRLSHSERYRLGVALQVAIARTTGVNLVVCDNAELLPPKELGQMLGLLRKAEVQAIVVRTLTGKTEEEFKKAPPKIDGVQVLWVKNENGVSAVEVL